MWSYWSEKHALWLIVSQPYVYTRTQISTSPFTQTTRFAFLRLIFVIFPLLHQCARNSTVWKISVCCGIMFNVQCSPAFQIKKNIDNIRCRTTGYNLIQYCKLVHKTWQKLYSGWEQTQCDTSMGELPGVCWPQFEQLGKIPRTFKFLPQGHEGILDRL